LGKAIKNTVEYWAKKLGLDQGEKTIKKRMKLREARKATRQSMYGEKVGHKAVKNQRKKKKDLKRIYQGGD